MSSSTGNVERKKAPYHRGFFATRINGWQTTDLGRGSRRLLSVEKSKKKRFFLTVVAIYGSDHEKRVALVSDDGTRKPLRRVFVKTRFPYFTLRADGGGYKSFNFKIGFSKSELGQTLQIETPGKNYDICRTVPVADGELFKEFKEVEETLSQLDQDAQKRTEKEFARIERSTIAFSDKSASISIDKALVHLNCLYLTNHRRAFRLYEKWSEAENTLGNEANVTKFKSHLDQITAPLAIGRHGFNPSFANLDLDQVEADLDKLMVELGQLSVSSFLNSGTLLGYYREGRPIPHDDDFDLGVIVKGETEERAAANWRKFVRDLEKQTSVILKGSFIAVELSNGVQVDLFPAWINDGKFFIYPYCWADVGSEAVMPLGTLNIRGREFAIPADPDALLTINYGPNWRVPDPFWRFDMNRAQRRFKSALKNIKAT